MYMMVNTIHVNKKGANLNEKPTMGLKKVNIGAEEIKLVSLTSTNTEILPDKIMNIGAIIIIAR